MQNKKVIPLRTDKQKAIIRTRVGQIFRKFKNRAWILDDESYFTLSHSTINGNGYYYSSDTKVTLAKDKFTK